MTPPLLQLLRSVAKPRATARLLKSLRKSPAVALLQRFVGVLAANSKISGDHRRKIERNRQRPRATNKLLKPLVKSPPVALLQRFVGVLAANNSKISGDHPRKIVQQRNRQRFPSKYQCLVCCTPICNRAQQAHRGA
jgi:hypothetical protein